MNKDTPSQDHLRLSVMVDSIGRQEPTPPLHITLPEGPLRTNLPVPITSFIGRKGELAAVRQCLAAARLVTLIGAGGVGKTRLALRVAAEAEDDYVDGVWLAELAPLTDPTLVPVVVAAVLGVRELAGVSIVQSLKQALHLRRMLLLLDNCEHLVQPCAELAEDLLGACPALQILATSREPLGTNGEVAWRVPSLDLPDPRAAAVPDQLTAHAATMLFIERATAARSDFRVTDENAAAIGEVCRRLDGIPLALEMAATRVRMLSLEQIAGLLDDRFRLLTGGRRTAPPRQQTLRATLDWSYALLNDADRQLFNRLSVFAGGWILEAAEAICAGPVIERRDVLERLGHLVDQSLVVAEEQGGCARYRLLENMRQYAAEKLDDSGESVVFRGRHRDWFLAQAEGPPLELFDPQHVAWLAQELDNLRAALQWSLQRGEIVVGLRLAVRMGGYWHQRGFYAEGRVRLAELFERPGAEAPTVARAMALGLAATLAYLQADLTSAERLSDEGLSVARRIADPWAIALALQTRAVISFRRGDLPGVSSLLEEALRISRAGGYRALEFYHLLILALAALESGDLARAGTLGEGALAVADAAGHVRGRPSALYVLGRVAAGRGAKAEARALLEDSLRLHREHADRDGQEVSLRGLAHLLLDQGEVSAARLLFNESLALAREGDDKLELVWSVEGLAGVALNTRPDRTVQLLGSAATTRDLLGTAHYPTHRERLDQWLEAARRTLGPAAYAAAWTNGRALPLEHAVALAVSEDAAPQSLRADHRPDPLSPREREVVRLVARGYTNRQIAEQLVIARRTADTHIGHVLTKLNLHSRSELAVWAVEHHLTATQADD